MKSLTQILALTATFLIGALSPVRAQQDPTVPTASALQFNATSSYVNFTPAISNLSFGDFTVSGWFNIPSDNATGQYLFRISNQESNVRRIEMLESNGVILADVRTAVGGTIYNLSSSAFGYGIWFHIAFVRSGSQLLLYFNGQQVASQTNATTLIPVKWGFPGANTESGTTWGKAGPGFFNGMFDGKCN